MVMELLVISVAVVGLATVICAIDDSVNWTESYRSKGREDLEYHENKNDAFLRVDYHE